MLEELRIENFAIVEKACLEFCSGLNIMTGETGAGKSLVVDALGLLLGERASTQFIRTGAQRAVVEGFFTVRQREVEQVLKEMGLEVPSDENLMLSREITRSGKNYCRVNGKTIPLNMYQVIGRLLVDIHGQNEQLSLLMPEKQLAMLDARGGEKLLQVLNKVETLFKQLEQVQKELKELQGSPGEREKLIDYYRFQLAEIRDARLREDEEEELLKRKSILQNAEKLLTGASQAYEYIFKGINQASAYDQLSQAVTLLEQLVHIDDSLTDIVSVCRECLYQLDDAARDLQNYLASADFDPNELEEVVNRLETLGELKRKYGSSVKEILNYQEQISKELDQFAQQEEKLTNLLNDKTKLEQDYHRCASELSKLRQDAAQVLTEEVIETLRQLDMPSVQFQCHFVKGSKPAPTGLDKLEFYLSPNLGEPLKPLAKIASGGEMARIMLALKAILAKVDSVETMVFDEADSGIGGLTAVKVGQKLAQIAKSRQVICITHSPQIACFGDCHYLLYKDNLQGRTVTRFKNLEEKARIRELARMLGGKPGDSTALKHAERLIKTACQEKCV